MLLRKLLFLIISQFLFFGCGKASFAVKTAPTAPTDIPIILLNTDFYAEIGQSLPTETKTEFSVNLAKVYSEALFTGTGNLDLEIRFSLVGDAAADQVVVTGQTKPRGWDQGEVIFNQAISGNNSLNPLESADVSALVEQIIQQGDFWINIRVRYGGPGVPRTATIQNAYAYIEGEKSLKFLSPLLYLSY